MISDPSTLSSGRLSSTSLIDIQAQLNSKTGVMPLWAKLAMAGIVAMGVSFGAVIGLSVMQDAEEASTYDTPDAAVPTRQRSPQLELVAVQEEQPIAEEEAPDPATVQPGNPERPRRESPGAGAANGANRTTGAIVTAGMAKGLGIIKGGDGTTLKG